MTCPLLLPALLILTTTTTPKVVFETTFDGDDPLASFRFTDAGAWRLSRVGDDPCLELHRDSTYTPPHRSPYNIAVLPTPVVSSFVLEADVMSTNRDYPHRDLCVFFGIESPSRYVYLHLGGAADATAHHVMRVDDADRRPITTTRTDGVDWGGQGDWHHVRVVYDSSARRVEAFFDGDPSPVLVATNVPVTTGYIGLGSFDDVGRFDRIRIEAEVAEDERSKLFSPPTPTNDSAYPLVTLSDDGGWCWFEGERAIIHRGQLLAGTVAAGVHDDQRRGDIELIRHDLATGVTTIVELDDRLERDDHDSPALLARAEGGVLAVWSRHGPDDRFYVRDASDDAASWSPRRSFSPSPTSRITYSNLFQLTAEDGRIYDFFRGLDGRWKPSYVWSDDGGGTWHRGHVVIDVPATRKVRPYVRYASDGRSRIHLLYTEGHPRDVDNSVYHVYYEGDHLHRSDGTVIGLLAEGVARPEDGTRVFQGDPDKVAWVVDARVDAAGHPHVVYSVQVGSAGLPAGQGGEDHRYRIAAWDGHAWRNHALAFAGTRLYAGEDDYTGLAAIDPDDPAVVYISTDADPRTGSPLVSRADGRRHYEVYQGRTQDGGKTWAWTPLTRDSSVDNIRPVVPQGMTEGTVVLWLRGRYDRYTAYDLDVVMTLVPE